LWELIVRELDFTVVVEGKWVVWPINRVEIGGDLSE
jgi:hypothetical protein